MKFDLDKLEKLARPMTKKEREHIEDMHREASEYCSNALNKETKHDSKHETKARKLAEILMQGFAYTAIELNQILNTGDARKYISRLRRKGVRIDSKVINTDGTKKYFIKREDI